MVQVFLGIKENNRTTAQRIENDDHALKVAASLASEFAVEAAGRDRERRLPYAEIEKFSKSGLWAITVPRAFGGADVKQTTLAEVFRRIARSDPSIAHIPQNHFSVVNALALDGNADQQKFFFNEILNGKRLGNAVSEIGTKNVREVRTKLISNGKDKFLLSGKKAFSTGALFADWIPVSASDEQDQRWLAIIPRSASGLTVIDDWNGFGQRTTASGTVVLDNVAVEPWQLVPSKRFSRPTLAGPLSQILHAAIDAGIAHAALEATREFVTTRSRPWIDSGVEKASDDPLTLSEVGRLCLKIQAADALLDRAARILDETPAESTPAQAGAASLAVAEAKMMTTEAVMAATNKLFELAGAGSTLSTHGLDRFWRDARTHTLHDPVRWKYHALGDHYLNGTLPPHHLWF